MVWWQMLDRLFRTLDMLMRSSGVQRFGLYHRHHDPSHFKFVQANLMPQRGIDKMRPTSGNRTVMYTCYGPETHELQC